MKINSKFKFKFSFLLLSQLISNLLFLTQIHAQIVIKDSIIHDLLPKQKVSPQSIHSKLHADFYSNNEVGSILKTELNSIMLTSPIIANNYTSLNDYKDDMMILSRKLLSDDKLMKKVGFDYLVKTSKKFQFSSNEFLTSICVPENSTTLFLFNSTETLKKPQKDSEKLQYVKFIQESIPFKLPNHFKLVDYYLILPYNYLNSNSHYDVPYINQKCLAAKNIINLPKENLPIFKKALINDQPLLVFMFKSDEAENLGKLSLKFEKQINGTDKQRNDLLINKGNKDNGHGIINNVENVNTDSKSNSESDSFFDRFATSWLESINYSSLVHSIFCTINVVSPNQSYCLKIKEDDIKLSIFPAYYQIVNQSYIHKPDIKKHFKKLKKYNHEKKDFVKSENFNESNDHETELKPSILKYIPKIDPALFAGKFLKTKIAEENFSQNNGESKEIEENLREKIKSSDEVEIEVKEISSVNHEKNQLEKRGIFGKLHKKFCEGKDCKENHKRKKHNDCENHHYNDYYNDYDDDIPKGGYYYYYSLGDLNNISNLYKHKHGHNHNRILDNNETDNFKDSKSPNSSIPIVKRGIEKKKFKKGSIIDNNNTSSNKSPQNKIESKYNLSSNLKLHHGFFGTKKKSNKTSSSFSKKKSLNRIIQMANHIKTVKAQNINQNNSSESKDMGVKTNQSSEEIEIRSDGTIIISLALLKNSELKMDAFLEEAPEDLITNSSAAKNPQYRRALLGSRDIKVAPKKESINENKKDCEPITWQGLFRYSIFRKPKICLPDSTFVKVI
ncbi:uncharacterized protein ASCRUDRAFT_79732 [Ascoidea rubescens DSM 1968]|uniref:Uncharacterized protein n=1 Tax=Ascoidea rubescens DSM 1968 TaxID=1344418 RepID=A0A1D2VNR4_9ASCO|nr:hypothetical protein ASCRUDRAFT_79732 [Ascoidea rubescens DSM 1968]ODV63195.1 hypothetical protein ASCRUDRAFT_79732 [Ascoidea rubescens DSM 1968]